MNDTLIGMRKGAVAILVIVSALSLARRLAPGAAAVLELRTRLALETLTQSVGLTGLLVSWALIAVLFAATVALAFGRQSFTEEVVKARREAETQSAARRETESKLRDANATIASQAKDIETLTALADTSAATDGLTGLPNHRAFHTKLKEECWRASRYEAPVSVVLLDIDHFRDYNDTFGVAAGDDVLKAAAALLRHSARACDYVARYGGEQFAIILPEATPAQAQAAAERFRAIIGGANWQKRRIAVSAGLASMSLGQPPSALAAKAERALSLAKTRGRDRVVADWDQIERLAA